MTSASENINAEQREFFRIDDTAIVQFRTVSETEYQQLASATNDVPDKLTLKAKFDCLSRQLQPLHRTISSRHPDVAKYLSMLDTKLNMLTEQLIKDELDEVANSPQVVNIGAGGMSFSSDMPVMAGSLLELRLVLLPEMTGILTYANVISCVRSSSNDATGNEYQVAVQFERMKDEVRDIISRHVLTREQARLRQQKQE